MPAEITYGIRYLDTAATDGAEVFRSTRDTGPLHSPPPVAVKRPASTITPTLPLAAAPTLSLFWSCFQEWYATQNVCPHKRALVLSEGIVGSKEGILKVACPLHKNNFALKR